jgi:hypothetical protein
MSNGKGLKDQWGVGDPAKAGSDKQAQQFQATFQREIACINGHLQYTSANAEAARHDPLAARRDALYPAFQSALGQIDRTNPAKAQGAIDKVLSDVKVLSGEVASFRKAAEKARIDWQTRQAKFDVAVRQVEELETWGDAKAPPLRGLVDGIRTQVNERKYAPACTTLDQLLPKLKPIYDDYQKQKAEKPKYEQGVAEKTARLDALKAVEKPSQVMTGKANDAGVLLSQAKAKADVKDFVGGSAILKTAQTTLDALDKLAKDPQRAKFVADRKAAEEMMNAAHDASFKSMEADWNAMLDLRNQADASADTGDYANGTKIMTALRPKVTAYQTKLEQLKKDRKAYEDALAAVQPQLAEFATAPPYQTLKARSDDIKKVKGDMEAAALNEDYVPALTSATDLKAKLDTFLPDLKKLQQEEEDYKKAWAAVEPKLTDALASARELAALKPGRDAVLAAKQSVEAAAKAEDFAKALGDVKDLETKIDTYLKDVKAKADDLKKKTDAVLKKINDADDSDRDDIARDWVKTLSPDEVKSMPSEVRNRLLEEMQDGTFSDEDKEGCKKLYSQNFLDPVFEKLDDEKRKKLIETMKNDPAFKDARDNWDKWPAAEKEAKRIAILKKAADYQAEAFGIAKTDVVAYSPKNPDGTLRPQRKGEYSDSDGQLKISREAMQNDGFDTVIDTVIHENDHRYQAALVKKLDKKEIKPGDPLYNQAMTFKLNEKYYVQPKIKSTDAPTPDRGDEYVTQPMEYHSRRNGEDVAAAGIGK